MFKRTVIFDGDCGFCQSQIRRGRALDWLGRIDWRMRSEPGLQEKFPQLSGEDTQGQMISIHPDGRTFGGFFAVRDIMIQLPLTFIPGLLMHIPGASLAGVPFYRWVAKNRHRFGGKTKSCEIGK